MLKFNSGADLTTVLDRLESDYETFNSNYENQFPGYTADQLDTQDSISNFNQWQSIETFENLFPGFSSKRKDLLTRENNWLNTVTDLTDANNPDSLDYSSDFTTNTVANINNKLIVGTDSYESKQGGLYLNGLKWEDDAPGSTFSASSSASNQALAAFKLCNYCDTCRNWQRKVGMSQDWMDNDGRIWRFEKIIAVRGISIDGRGHIKATIKAYRKSGNKWKKKRGWCGLQMQGTVWSNQCTTPKAFNSGVFASSRPRNFFMRKYAAVSNRFFRTKKMKVVGTYTLNPKGNGTPFGETQYLTW